MMYTEQTDFDDMTEVIAMFRERGIIVTLQRMEIAQTLLSRPQHLSADQILSKVNNGREGDAIVSKATVYNTLRLFVEKGLVREIFADPTQVYYEPATGDHYHFYRTDTGELIDVDTEAIPMGALPSPPTGMEVRGVDVVIRIEPAQA